MSEVVLETKNLNAFYGDFQALFGVDITLHRGEVVGLVGANGAGKSTLLRTITGLLSSAVDSVCLKGRSVGGCRAEEIVKLGIAMVPEGRKLFPSLSVEENLTLGAYAGRGGQWTLESIFRLFPILKERRKSLATRLSGGQQQMVAIGRALMANPDVLLCDEISLGLAPVVIADVYAAMPLIRESGMSVVVVEQDIGQVLRVTDRLYCLREGRVVLSGTSCALKRDEIAKAYFGMVENTP